MNSENSFCPMIIRAFESQGDKEAMRIVGVENSSYTFRQVLDSAYSIAYKLEQEGVAFGDRVVVVGENHPRWAIAYFGVVFRGAVCVPVDPHGEISTIANFFDNSEAKMAFIGEEFKESFQKIQEKLGRKIPAVVLQADAPEGEFQSFQDWTNAPRPADFTLTLAKPEDLAQLMYTSGTTGTPKGVPITHDNIYSEIIACREMVDISNEDVVLSVLPLFHVFAQVVNLWTIASIGGRIFYLKELAPAEIEKAFKTGEVTILTGVPRIWYLFHKKIFDTVESQSIIVRKLFATLLKTSAFLRNNFKINAGKKLFKKVHDNFGGKLKTTISAGSRFDGKIARDYEALGFTMIQGYGLTETTGAISSTSYFDSAIGTVGKPMKGIEIKLGEPNDDGAGEVLIRGKMVFSGYYKNPQATAEIFTPDGFFKSGDLGKYDSRGNLSIVGRSKDVIVLPNGKNIHPEDLEVHYSKTPLIEEISILGIKDKSSAMAGAEKLIAVVVPDFTYLKQNNISNAKEAIRYDLDDLGRQLPEYQRVRDYVFHSEPLPRTSTRKVKRFQLQKEIEEQGGLEDQELKRKPLALTAADSALLDSNVGRAVVSVIKKNARDVETIHPAMNMEIDLGLDSLGRAEVFAALESAFNTDFEGEEAAKALTVSDAIKLVQSKVGDTAQTEISTDLNWSKIVRESDDRNLPEVQGILENRTFFPALAFGVYQIFRFISKIFMRLEVENKEVFSKLKRPFIIAPNHQSYLDPFVITPNYPYEIFKATFHVGASQYFQSGFMRWLGDLLQVVPVDADTQLLKAMKASAIGLRHGRVLNIYPEGERAFDGKMQPFKKGAAILATELDLPILPVAIDGIYNVWGRGSNKIRSSKVKIKFGEPFYAKDVVPGDLEGDAKYEAVTEHLRNTIQAMIAEMRQ